MVSGGTYTGTESTVYTIKIVTAGTVGNAEFQWMKTGGSWSGNIASGVDVSIENGVTVSFYNDYGAFALDDTWTIRASIPFMRTDSSNGALCAECHVAWSNSNDYNRISTDPAPNVGTWESGQYHSHPTGYTLNSNGRGNDHPFPQDVSADDRNETNDLKLDSSNRVQCTSCHGMHFCDSNTITKDGR